MYVLYIYYSNKQLGSSHCHIIAVVKVSLSRVVYGKNNVNLNKQMIIVSRNYVVKGVTGGSYDVA